MKTPNGELSNIPSLTKEYMNMADKVLVIELGEYVTGLTTSSFFPTLTTQIAGYVVDVTTFREAYLLAKSTRAKSNIIAKDDARDAVILSTIAISNAVTQLANGNLAALASTNLPMKKTRQPIVPVAPETFTLTAGKVAGELKVRFERPKGTFSIIARYAPAIDGAKPNWTNVNSLRARFIIPGLESGQKYNVQMGLVIKENVELWGATILSPYVP